MNTTQRQPKLFQLVRPTDVSGAATHPESRPEPKPGSSLPEATVTVAEGVEWSDGAVALRWRGPWVHTSSWDGIDAVLAAHQHTVLHWLVPPHRSRPAADATPPRRPPTTALWLPAPGPDGCCPRCGAHWPCLGCDS